MVLFLFELKWKTDETSFEPFMMVQMDYPLETANYILNHKIGSPLGHSTNKYTRWARYYKGRLNKAIRQFRKIADGSYNTVTRRAPNMIVSSSTLSPTGDVIKLVRRVVQAKEDIPAVRTPHRGTRR